MDCVPTRFVSSTSHTKTISSETVPHPCSLLELLTVQVHWFQCMRTVWYQYKANPISASEKVHKGVIEGVEKPVSTTVTLWCSATCQLRKIEQLCSVDNCIFTASRFCFSEVGGVVFVGFFFWVVVGGGVRNYMLPLFTFL